MWNTSAWCPRELLPAGGLFFQSQNVFCSWGHHSTMGYSSSPRISINPENSIRTQRPVQAGPFKFISHFCCNFCLLYCISMEPMWTYWHSWLPFCPVDLQSSFILLSGHFCFNVPKLSIYLITKGQALTQCFLYISWCFIMYIPKYAVTRP